ncbi:MAG TPA: lipoprotein-releasing system ATP-binding protein LolD [Cellvibrionales bacterium]|jgi:lipoprotein-releasing system ATP-binding protein|nr:ATP-binding cassette domain-containing protein [Pseudomonadales bacterium]HAB55453.1 lipoprotein-releasing system ATP-binding protein LolD [Cellvibrionales bacterium]HCX27033.1 lipoprotein-releasing system ATP-binding protein LolD [Cellvibrionales bacterium]
MTTLTSTTAESVATSPNKPVLVCTDLGKSYSEGGQSLTILEQVALTILPAERIAIVGASGSGKTTLLNLLGGLDKPSTGDVSILGQSLLSLDDQALSAMRNKTLGFVYQFHHLLPEFTALENVLMPLMIARKNKQQSIQIATELLASVGLSQRVTHRPSALSGGERQRVAIARALANNPACVLMDEPTGNLDRQASDSIERLMDDLAQQLNTAFVVVTHDQNVAARMDSIYRLEARRLERQA